MRIEANLGQIAPLEDLRGEGPLPPLTPAPSTSFADVIAGAVHQASALSGVADVKADALARGALDDLHGTMIASKEAEISLHLVGTIRNRLLDAFHELWRTSI
jgi:flagellar hook-basal body complex protein FliE